MDMQELLNGCTVPNHSCVRIEDNGIVVYVDPYGLPSRTADADLIAVTHSHYDHFSPEAIDQVLKAGTEFVAPVGMEQDFAKAGISLGGVHFISPGESVNYRGIQIEGIPAYNTLKPFHPKRSGWLGYRFAFPGRSVYVTGDTDAKLECVRVHCDLLFIPVGGTYTFDARAAAKVANEIHPAVAVPIHYGQVVGNRADAEKFCSLLDDSIAGEILL